MTHSTLVLPILLALAGCSARGSGDESSPIGPEPTSTASTQPGTGGAPPSDLNYQTADWVMERLPGEYDSSAQVEEFPDLVGKHLWVCELDAPELGERVLYVERSNFGSLDSPDTQVVLAIDAASQNYNNAIARLYVPSDRATWVGLCRTANPTAPSPLEVADGCDHQFAYNDATLSTTMSVNASASCVQAAPPSAMAAFSEVIFDGSEVRWHDAYFFEGGEVVEDPGAELQYVLRRISVAQR